MANNWIKKLLVIFFVGLFLYFPSLFFNFTYFDDQVLILENLSFLKNPRNFFRAFQGEVFHPRQSFGFYYRPVLTLSFMIDAWFSGSSPFFYHLSNIIYHLLASFLVFLFFKKLKIEEKTSFILSLIFLVHPVLTQAVSWIPGRNDSLLTIFTLACFLSFINYLETERLRWIFFHFVFFLLALLTKESSLLIPFFGFLFIILFYLKKARYLLLFFFGWWFCILFWIILRENAIKNLVYLKFDEIIRALIFHSPALIQYLGKIFFPVNLSVLPTIKDTSFLWGILTLIILTVFLVIFEKDYRLLIFGFSWFVFFLLPNFIRPNPAITADFLEHRVYLPLVGFLLGFSGFKQIRENFFRFKIGFYFLISVFFTITFFHQFKFKNRLVFWQNAVLSSPHSPLAHRNYGVMLYFEKRFDEAKKEYLEALKLNPKEPMVYNNLGVIYMNEKKWEKAIESFKKELEINPDYDNALYNLGTVYYQTGDKEKAKNFWEKTIEVNPYYFSAYLNLADYYQKENQKEKASYYLLLYQRLKEER